MFHTISRELKYINKQIDTKIVKGVSYRHDAARHKMLLSQLARSGQRGRLAQAFSFFSFL